MPVGNGGGDGGPRLCMVPPGFCDEYLFFKYFAVGSASAPLGPCFGSLG